MASKLSLYSNAALILGERKIASLDESAVMRRRLDTAYDAGVVAGCLGRGLWNFAIRAVKLDYSPSVEPDFGYQRAFNKPEDWIRTVIVASDEFFTRALTLYSDEAAYLFADLNVLYARFVSDADNYGMDMGNWPENFTELVEHSLALKVAKATTGSSNDVDELEARVKRLLVKARSSDAMDEPTQFPPRGSWASARVGSTRER